MVVDGRQPRVTVAAAQARLAELLRGADGRVILGLTGAPGAGKSTLAARLVASHSGAVLVGMDAFHLAHETLVGLGTVARKGAPDTFDADGYVALLRRVRAGEPRTIWVPEFRREIEDSIAGVRGLAPDVRLVVTEGNYLLLDDERWSPVRELCDEIWYVEVAEATRLDRLVARHVRFGRSREEAYERSVSGTDAANARLIEATRGCAVVVVVVD
jgi:pantothenate kinase